MTFREKADSLWEGHNQHLQINPLKLLLLITFFFFSVWTVIQDQEEDNALPSETQERSKYVFSVPPKPQC